MIITSRFPGRCLACQRGIQVGDQVSWIKGRSGAEHATCSAEGKVAAVAVQASRAVDAAIEIPAPDGMAYLPYQRGGIAYAAARPGTLIADEMGLGKTIQVLGLINADPTIRSTLVICPKSLTLNWYREARRWLVRDTTIGLANGTVPPSGLVIASYDGAKKHQAALAARAWDLVVVDEAHLIKNQKAQRTKTVHAIAATARKRVALTGTPIANRPVELFSLLKLVDPGHWDQGPKGGFFAFARRYANAHQTRYGWDFSGASNLPELQDRLRATCMVRRLKADVLTELPPKRRQVVEVGANGAASAVRAESEAFARQEAALNALRVEAELARASEDPDAYGEAVGRLSDKVRAGFDEISRLRHDTAVAKIPAVIDHVRDALEDNDGHKIVIFAHHLDVLHGLTAGLAEFGAVMLSGQTSLEDRQAAVDRFQTDPTCRVFVGSIQAAGVGITLTASAHVVMAELDWVPGNVSQAEDRCHRIGQAGSVLVQHLVLDGSLDARMAHVLIGKQAVMDAGLDALTVAREPALPGDRPATETTRAKLDATAATLGAEDIERIHQALRQLAGMCDGAQSEDGAGFSKIDVAIGHSLAAATRLSARQAALGLKLVRKYRRQVGDPQIAA